MFKFTSLFLNNLFCSSGSILPSTSLSSGWSTITVAFDMAKEATYNNDNSGLTIALSVASIGTTITNSVADAYQETKKQLEVTDSYIESLNEEELTYLIAKLEEKEKILISEENEQIKVKINEKKI